MVGRQSSKCRKTSVLLHKSREKLMFKLWRLAISTPVDLEKSYIPLLKALRSGKADLQWKWEYLSHKWSHILLKNTILLHSSLEVGVFFILRLYLHMMLPLFEITLFKAASAKYSLLAITFVVLSTIPWKKCLKETLVRKCVLGQ